MNESSLSIERSKITRKVRYSIGAFIAILIISVGINLIAIDSNKLTTLTTTLTTKYIDNEINSTEDANSTLKSIYRLLAGIANYRENKKEHVINIAYLFYILSYNIPMIIALTAFSFNINRYLRIEEEYRNKITSEIFNENIMNKLKSIKPNYEERRNEIHKNIQSLEDKIKENEENKKSNETLKKDLAAKEKDLKILSSHEEKHRELEIKSIEALIDTFKINPAERMDN